MDMDKHTASMHAAASTCPMSNAEQTGRRFGLRVLVSVLQLHMRALS